MSCQGVEPITVFPGSMQTPRGVNGPSRKREQIGYDVLRPVLGTAANTRHLGVPALYLEQLKALWHRLNGHWI